jgi:hypothetical protein
MRVTVVLVVTSNREPQNGETSGESRCLIMRHSKKRSGRWLGHRKIQSMVLMDRYFGCGQYHPGEQNCETHLKKPKVSNENCNPILDINDWLHCTCRNVS